MDGAYNYGYSYELISIDEPNQIHQIKINIT